MKNKLLLALAIVAVILVAGVIIKKTTEKKYVLTKADSLAVQATFNKLYPKNNTQPDSTNYWRMENSLFPTIYRFDKDTGTIFTTARDPNWNEKKVQYHFDCKKIGDLIMLNYVWGLSTKTEYWTVFNENTLVNTVENQKLKRINH